ncbi:hypothetical protein B5C34_00055 [Pacificimonas flava]|uniref:Ice-binding protein C-terminal domain-containing protein n=2 Tax=Pacificimonas TaxID=1960290 RepID=A0A219B2F8_9SPHN|nr:hypothetical protein B5C34_00055 [Pacificimonas flava]
MPGLLSLSEGGFPPGRADFLQGKRESVDFTPQAVIKTWYLCIYLFLCCFLHLAQLLLSLCQTAFSKEPRAMLTKAILAAGVALTATAASAVTITLDDFTTQFEVGSVAGPLVTDGAAVTSDAQVVGSGATRTGTLEVTGNGSPGTNFASLTSTGGQIQLSQDSSVDGQFTLTYNIGSILFDAYNTMSNPEDLGTLDVFVSNSDGNPRTLSLSLNGVVQDTTASAQFIDGSASFPAETQSLSFDPDELTGSDVFVFSFNPFENTDWTATFLEFNIEEVPPPPPTDVPAPAALGLLGMGLAGVGFSRRRRKTA